MLVWWFVALATGLFMPHYESLTGVGNAVVSVVFATAFVGIGLCFPRRSRAFGAGVVVGAGLGFALVWCVLVLFLALFLGA